MIRRWLEAFRDWLLAPIVARLELIETRTMEIQARHGLPVEPRFQPTQVLRTWDCGHESVSGATHADGRTQCLACHQAELLC